MIRLNKYQFRRSTGGAFSLVEVALALGIVSFGLVGVLGTLPIAVSTARDSIAQTRAVEVANSVFSSFAAQAFNQIYYVDAQFSPTDGVTPSGSGPAAIDLTAANTPSGYNDDTVSRQPNTLFNVDNQYIRFFASVVDDPATAYNNGGTTASSDPARLKYTIQPPVGGYQIILHFNSAPDGVAGTGLSNRIDMLVSETDRPATYYRFSRALTNRAGNIILANLASL